MRALRERALLSQEELAERSGLSIGAVRSLETGRTSRPRMSSVRQLANALELSGADRTMLVAAARTGRVDAGAGRRPYIPVTPAQLPTTGSGFTGRADALKTLEGLLPAGAETPPGPLLVTITGTAGVGKTTLALHWAHRVAHRFPDGQLFVNLRGFASTPPLRPIDALMALLRSLGTPPDLVPAEVEEAAASFRSTLAGRQVLIVLDNARSAEQVRPLLPGSPGCLTIVTSRDRLGSLVPHGGARRLTLDVMPPDEAVGMLVALLGPDRVDSEPQATTALARVCAYLPLALCIASVNLIDHPHRRIADRVAELERNPLARLELGDGDGGVRAAFDRSYQTVPAAARGLFRRHGLLPGPEFTAAAVAAAAGIDPEEARRLLELLGGAHLLEERAVGRYGCHDLLRRYAIERAAYEDTDACRKLTVN